MFTLMYPIAHQPTRAHLREPFRESTPVCESPSAYKMYQPVSQPASQSTCFNQRIWPISLIGPCNFENPKLHSLIVQVY